jgi:hypothetical protein
MPKGGITCAASPSSVTPGTWSQEWPAGSAWIGRLMNPLSLQLIRFSSSSW